MSFAVWLIFIPTVAITIGVFAWVVRSMLGVQFTALRLLMAGLVSYFCFTPIMNGMVGSEEFVGGDLYPTLWFFMLASTLSLVCGMMFLVIAEALIPSNQLPGPLYMLRAIRRWKSRSGRYLQIGSILFRNGLIAYVGGGRRSELRSTEGRRDLALRLRAALSQGGVTFIKLGQILSTRRDLLPPEFVEELALLQDRANPVPWGEIEAILGDELGDLHAHFASIDQVPLASASIAQVHTATLLTGEEVVVKVRRPGIDAQVERDLDVLHKLAGSIESRTSWGRTIGVTDLADGFAKGLREELDLRVEARNMLTVAAAAKQRKDATGLAIPTLYPAHSTGKVLVMERIVGVKLIDAGPEVVRRGLDSDDLARTLLESLLRQIVIDGTFHADPHPGNVMLTDNDKLTLLDFGSVGRMDAVLRSALLRLMMTFETGDPIAATDALLDLVQRPEHLDEQRLERALGTFMARHLAPGVPPDMTMVPDLFRVLSQFGLSAPPEVAAAFRAIATLDGTLTNIAPGFNMLDEARAFARTYLLEQMRPRALQQTLTSELMALLPMIRRLPRRIDRIAASLEEGRLNVNVRSLADARDRHVIDRLVREVLMALLACTAGVMAALLMGQEGGPMVTSTVSMFQLLGYGLLVAALVLALRVLVQIFRGKSDPFEDA